MRGYRIRQLFGGSRLNARWDNMASPMVMSDCNQEVEPATNRLVDQR